MVKRRRQKKRIMRKDYLDTHTHTIASGHAYNTLNEMMAAASQKGLSLLGVTDHGNGMKGTTPLYYFENSPVIDRSQLRQRFGVELLFGVELNIMDFDGSVDMQPSLLEKMDVTIASMHVPCMPKGTKAEITRAYLSAMENPLINIIGHPDDGRFPVDYQELVRKAGECHVALEVNDHSLDGTGNRQNAVENDSEMLRWCIRYQVPVVLNSDAHSDTKVGCHEHAWALLEKMHFPEELILNSSLEKFRSYVNCYRIGKR